MEENHKLSQGNEQGNKEQPQFEVNEAGKETDHEQQSFTGPEPAAAAETAPVEKNSAETSSAGWLSKLGEKVIGSVSKIPGLQRPLKKLGPAGTALGTITTGVLVVGLGTLLLTGGVTEHTSAKVKPAPLKWILTYEDQSWEADLRKMGFDGKDPKTLDPEKWEKWFAQVEKDVEKPAVDAQMERLNSPIEPEKEGREIQKEKVEEWIANLPEGINKPRKLPVETLEPKVTAAQLEQVDQKRIGRYTTRYNPGEINRTTNVRLSSQAINNLVLNPGEEFSFNETVGQRTAQRGYKNATVIVNGEFTDGMGGGICQTSSTLYNSVDHAGLKVTARFSHSKEVTYVPQGRDATVAWYGPDFKFQNSLSKPIMIKSTANGGYLTVEIFTSP